MKWELAEGDPWASPDPPTRQDTRFTKRSEELRTRQNIRFDPLSLGGDALTANVIHSITCTFIKHSIRHSGFNKK